MLKIILNKKIPSFEQTGQSPHPWIFRNSIKSVAGNPDEGDIVSVVDATADFIGYGHYSEIDGIAIRLISLKKEEYPDPAFITARINQAISFREKLSARISSDCVRLVFAESDGLPGLIADKYGDLVAMQILTSGMEKIKSEIASCFIQAGFKGVLEMQNRDSRQGETEDKGPLFSVGETGPENMIIEENGHKFNVNFSSGQKTGFFMDQRDNRQIVSRYVQPEMKILDCFSYTGAFSVYALKQAQASALLLDSSEEALAMAEKNLLLNGIDDSSFEIRKGDAFSLLREFRDRNLKFDLIILDPPKFAPYKSMAKKALRGYKDINVLAIKMLAEDGILATFSCSSGVSSTDFRQMLERSARDAGRNFKILEQFHQPPDHPIALNCPESEYLKGFMIQVC